MSVQAESAKDKRILQKKELLLLENQLALRKEKLLLLEKPEARGMREAW